MEAKRFTACVLLICLFLSGGISIMDSVNARETATTLTLQQVKSYEQFYLPIYGRYMGRNQGTSDTILSNYLPQNYLEVILEDQTANSDSTAGRIINSAELTDADWMAEGNQNSAELGWSVASAGDVNGDGYDDVIVGAPSYDFEHFNDAGAVFLWYGSAAGLGANGDPTNAPWKVLSSKNDMLGYSVGTAGDVNGDGYDDVIVGAPRFDTAELNRPGAAFLWYGSESGLGGDGTLDGADWIAHGNHDNAWFGWAVGVAGDVNGDGYDDVIVGAQYYDNGQLYDAGAAFVWHGSAAGLGDMGTFDNADWKVVGEQVSEHIGYSVSTAGDVNGDGYDEVIIGANGYDNDDFVIAAGAAFVWYGSEAGLGLDGTADNADWMADGDKSDARYGISVGTTGDVNADGFDDVIVGASGYDNDQIDKAGAAFVWYGSIDGLGETGTSDNADWQVLGDQTSGLFGWSAGGAGDVNGDGYDDAIVGTHGYNFYQGICLVFYGSTNGLLPRSLAWSVEPAEQIRLGFSTGTAGDVNGDGVSDVIMGAISYQNPDAYEGAAFVFHGQIQPHLLLDISGPTTAAPGQTVDYAISYANFLTTTVEDAILIIALPGTAEFVDSTVDGIYWRDRHEVFWKLGELFESGSGTMSVRIRHIWGVPLGTQDSAVANLVGSNWGQDYPDYSLYLNYVPPEVPEKIPLTEQDLLALNQIYPDLESIYLEALARGFIFGGISRLDYSTNESIHEIVLVNFDSEEVIIIYQQDEVITAAAYSLVNFSLETPAGGYSVDLLLDTVEYIGGEAGNIDPVSSRTLETATTCQFDERSCLYNCILDVIGNDIIGNLPGVSSTLTSYDCLKWQLFPDDEQARNSCLIGIVNSAAPGAQAAAGAIACGQDCSDPDNWDLYFCSEDKIVCEVGSIHTRASLFLNQVTLGQTRVYPSSQVEYRCNPDTCRYESGQSLPCPNRCVPGIGCQPWCTGAAQNPRRVSGVDPCLAAQEAGGACDFHECAIQTAHDPNAKYGYEGDVLSGQPLTYTVTFENEGVGPAYGVFVADILDEDLNENTLQVYGGEYLSPTRMLRWEIGELAPSINGNISFTVAVSPGLASGTVIVNEAVVHFPSVPEETPTNAVVNVIQPVVAYGQHVETTYASPISITLSGKDAADAALTYFIVEEPNNGHLSGSPPDLNYTPRENFTGPDRFSFAVDNGIMESRPADVTVMVWPSSEDETAPLVLWTRPGDGEVITIPGIATLTDTVGFVYPPSLLVKFSEPMDSRTMTVTNVLVESVGGGEIDVSVIYQEWSNWMTIAMRESWQEQEYTVTLSTGLKDASGNQLVADYAWSFIVILTDSGNFSYIPLVLNKSEE